jgi:uncharacterized protein
MKKDKKICINQNEDGKFYMPDSEVNIQKRYQAPIDDVLNFFKKLNNKNIYSIYLRGSIVFGLGIKNISDIDFFIVTLRPLVDFDRLTIKRHMDKLNKKYPFITKFDIGYFTLDQILTMKENVLIKLTSLCLYGKDIKSKIKDPKPGKDVAISLSHLEEEIFKTRNEIRAGLYDKTNTKAMCVWIMKRIVRSGLELVSEREKCFTRDLGLCYEKFSKYYPDKKDDMHKVLTLALEPTNNSKVIEKVFNNLGKWLVLEGKNLGLTSISCNDINKIVVEKTISLFGKNRIICLLRYGPKIRFDGTPPTDFDFLLLLDKYQSKDYLLLSFLKKLNLPIEVFVDYKDQILLRGIKNYQRGRHGSYFFKILASADTLLGRNFYKESEGKSDKNKIKSDLLYRIEEYFYRIQKSVLNEQNFNKKDIEKYLGRIVTDLLLVTDNIQFSDMHKYHYTRVMYDMLDSSNIVNHDAAELIAEFRSRPEVDIDLLGKLVGPLYEQYLEISKKIRL